MVLTIFWASYSYLNMFVVYDGASQKLKSVVWRVGQSIMWGSWPYGRPDPPMSKQLYHMTNAPHYIGHINCIINHIK